MNELVALHTQQLAEPAASGYLDRLARGLRAARLNATFPDRRALAATLGALSSKCHRGLYDSIYLDARTGMPNMASFTRVLSDRDVALGGRDISEVGKGSRDQAFSDRMDAKRAYYADLGRIEPAPVDEHRVLLRRHEPELGRASFRVELTKLDSTGVYLRVVIELTQEAGVWAHKLVDVTPDGEVVSGTTALRGMVYRLAGFDAETLFLRLHELEGVHVERVQRGMIGPVLFAMRDGDALYGNLEAIEDPLADAFAQFRAGATTQDVDLVFQFATDMAAPDIREERSNDPLSPLFEAGIREGEQARYRALREKYAFKVYKDRKFVVTGGARPLVETLCSQAATKNLIYNLR